jgi:hypothetical protein
MIAKVLKRPIGVFFPDDDDRTREAEHRLAAYREALQRIIAFAEKAKKI